MDSNTPQKYVGNQGFEGFGAVEKNGQPVKREGEDVMPQVEYDEAPGLHRGLKPRHISLISIGGIIGTGLFIGTGTGLANGGPLGLWLGFTIIGAVVYFLMQGLGEMAAYLPIVGAQLTFAGRFFDPALSFALSWNTTLHWALTSASELSAIAVLMNYWVSPDRVNNAVWIAIGIIVVVCLNLGPAAVYGETEFIFSSIKVLTITGLIICGICINCGAGPDGHYLGFHYWRDPGPFTQFGGIGGAKGQFLGFWAVMTQAAFSYGGTEMIAIAAAESKNPRRAIPRATRQVYFRIGLFYILGTLILGLNVPSNNDRLGAASDSSASPWVIAIELAGIKALPSIVNGCLITSAWSASNADIYTSSRALYALSRRGWAPKVFMTVNRLGTPWISVLTVSLLSLLAFMTVSTGAAVVFNWFVSLLAIIGVMDWLAILITYVAFRRGQKAQGFDRSTLPFRSRTALPGAYFAIVVIILVTIFSGWTVFRDVDHFDQATFITNYLPAVWFPLLYVGYKIYKKTKIVNPYEMDLYSGVAEIEASEEYHEPAVGILAKMKDLIF